MLARTDLGRLALDVSAKSSGVVLSASPDSSQWKSDTWSDDQETSALPDNACEMIPRLRFPRKMHQNLKYKAQLGRGVETKPVFGHQRRQSVPFLLNWWREDGPAGTKSRRARGRFTKWRNARKSRLASFHTSLTCIHVPGASSRK